MSERTVKFSDQEITFIQDQQFLLTKIEIGQKIEQLLGEVEQNLYAVIPEYSWPPGVLLRSGKISKGENYNGLPYYILDYPRRFDRDHVFAFRTMFWWGNFFSATMHLGGEYLEMSRASLIANSHRARASEWYICINNTPWEYHYGPDNYQRLRDLTPGQLQSILRSRPFVKLSQKWPVDQYKALPSSVHAVFKEMLSWMILQR